MQAKSKIQQFLEERLLVEFSDTTTEDVNLFRAGAIDSFGLAELVVFLEAEFHIVINNEELLGGHLSSLSGMVALVERKQHEVVQS